MPPKAKPTATTPDKKAPASAAKKAKAPATAVASSPSPAAGKKATATALKAVPVRGGASTNADRVVLTESLLATDAEKHATSKSLYGDSSARISSNVFATHDRVRQRAYEALFRSIKGKTMLHLGCGMGLYSMLAARAGARHVTAIDTSAIVDPARVVAEQNGLTNITFLRGRLRDVLKDLPAAVASSKYDVILCEWMGTFLVNEDILSDVLYARENLLAPNGTVCPNKSSIHVVGVYDYNFRLDTEDFWSNVYGFPMEPMKQLVRSEVEMCSIPADNIMTAPSLAYTVDVEALPALTAEETSDYEANSNTAEETAAVEAAKAAKAAAAAAASSSGKVNGGGGVEKKRNENENPVEARWTPYASAQAGIEASFTLTAMRDCTINYLTFYVDASFVSKVDTGANFVLGIRPGGANAWTEVSVGLLEALPLLAGEKVSGTVKAFTPVEKGGRVTVVQVSAKTEGMIAPISTSGEYYYQPY